MLAIETDENQHKNYSKEDEIPRYNDLYIFIWFNPDKYKNEKGKTTNTMLKDEIDKQNWTNK